MRGARYEMLYFFRSSGLSRTDQARLRAAILTMTADHGVDAFYIGHQGAFDRMVLSILRELALPDIRCTVVLSRMPAGSQRIDSEVSR